MRPMATDAGGGRDRLVHGVDDELSPLSNSRIFAGRSQTNLRDDFAHRALPRVPNSSAKRAISVRRIRPPRHRHCPPAAVPTMVTVDLTDTVVEYLSRFDAGIAPTMNDVVREILEHRPFLPPSTIRQTVAELERAGTVLSRWDDDAHIYWCDR